MLDNLSKKQVNDFLLSLNLIDNKLSDKDKIRLLYILSNNIEKNYKRIELFKKNGTKRIIYEPNYLLKQIQRNILDNILYGFKPSKYATAYIKGLSIKDNVKVHINKKVILKLDIKDFFNNISFMDIYRKVFKEEYFPKQIRILLCYLCTYNEFLPQGSPTSGYISNLVMNSFDEIIGGFCKERNISYTRYSDDMTFSGDFNIKEVIYKVKEELKKLGLQLNYKKIKVIYNNNSQQVTGIVVNKKAQVIKERRRKIRQEIYYIRKYGVDSHLKRIKIDNKNNYLISLLGKINYILMINKDDRKFIEYKKYIKSIIN